MSSISKFKREVRTFSEVFGLQKIQAPSFKLKIAKKIFKGFRDIPLNKKKICNPKESYKGKTHKKTYK